MSKNFEKVKDYYTAHLEGKPWGWDIDRVFNVTGKSTGITEEEYNDITSFIYPNKEKQITE